jgi:hypothetical protein
MWLAHVAGAKWSKLEPAANPFRLRTMKKLILLLAVVTVLGSAATGCRHAGSREFIPGRGWVPN